MELEVSPIEWRKGDTLRLGIVVDWPLVKPTPSRAWPDHLYAHLADEGAECGALVYVFNPNGVDWRRARVQGWVKTTSKGEWIPRVLPFPHAVYNRISRREVEASRACRRAIARLSKAAPLFNPRYLDKGEVQLALEQSPAASYLPPACVTRDIDEMIERVEELRATYIKPVSGSLGNGVMRVERRGKGFRLLRNPPLAARAIAPVSKHLTRAQLRQTLARHCKGASFLVQKAIDLPRWRGLPFDLRLLIQKDETSEWRLTGAAGRVAAPGALTTHTIRGGSRLPYHRLALEASVTMPSLSDLETMCRHAAIAVQETVGEDCFEFSLDAAVSPDGRPLILEVNAKPFPFDEIEIRREAARRLLAYAEARASQNGATSR